MVRIPKCRGKLLVKTSQNGELRTIKEYFLCPSKESFKAEGQMHLGNSGIELQKVI